MKKFLIYISIVIILSMMFTALTVTVSADEQTGDSDESIVPADEADNDSADDELDGTFYALGDFTEIENDGLLCGWVIRMNNDVRAAERLEAEFEEWIDFMTFVAFGDGNGWDWVETSVDVDGTRVSINLAELDQWADVLTGSQVKFMMTINYSRLWEDMGLQNAALVSGDYTIFAPIDEPEPPVQTPDDDPSPTDTVAAEPDSTGDDKTAENETSKPTETQSAADDKTEDKDTEDKAGDPTMIIIIIAAVVLAAVVVVIIIAGKGKSKK